ncbi:hypothetical protein F442_22496 [Phytophthora nicotianae P10297]|uniref:Uncharacterized protein n=2 Tax=Phytophthora nicotianae TaxID=4792 RepID=W2XZF1_PHYNI|nr:hypothetical protein L915_21998 [Phytophthora nicotianae]ETL88330.1 hypothetical protein L917_12582 [Phytophthora nicotianae]ETP28215.1 hypothetical protein F442_22496 [Phytophthora nicotianae P10297]
MDYPSASSSRCVNGAPAHVAPDMLDARVKRHIIQGFRLQGPSPSSDGDVVSSG